MLDVYKTPIARRFAGAEYLTNGDGMLLPATDPVFTLAVWFRPASIGATECLVSYGALAGSAAANYAGIQMNASGQVQATWESVSSTTTQAATANTWTHAAAVFTSNASRTAYINGTAATPNTTSRGTATMVTLRCGATCFTVPTLPFTGQLAWPAAWNVALSAGDIAMLASGVPPWQVRPESLVACYDFTGAELESSRGRSAHFMLTNTGSVPINGPSFLRHRIATRYPFAVAGGAADTRRFVIS